MAQLANAEAAGRPDRAIRVFVSYSRRNASVAERLALDLDGSGFEAFLDKHDILPGEPWQERLRRLIEGSDSVVFLLSPESVASEVCDWEVNEAERIGKRLIPVVIGDVAAEKVPRRLTRLNYIFMRSEAEEADGLGKLRSALRTDIEWIREHTRIGELALDWQEKGRPKDRLKRGRALTAAESWLASRPREAPEVTELQRDYILESRRSELAEFSRERQILTTRQRRLTGIAGLLAAFVFGLVAWLNQGWLAEQYQWRVVMQQSVLTRGQEQELRARPGAEFSECKNACPAMVVIPAGAFMMGSELAAETEPLRKVTMAKPFAVAKTEVTYAQYDACTAIGACPTIADNTLGRDSQPVIEVSWEEAQAYAAWLTRLTGRRYRLLTEAEWEYAARGITDARAHHPIFPWGDDPGVGNANCRNCGSRWDQRRTAPAGMFAPNAFGLHDMAGNVWEWVEDNWHPTYEGAPSDGSAWTAGGDQDRRVARGGSWLDLIAAPVRGSSSVAGSHGRTRDTGFVRQHNIGFRIARTLD